MSNLQSALPPNKHHSSPKPPLRNKPCQMDPVSRSPRATYSCSSPQCLRLCANFSFASSKPLCNSRHLHP
ncbi:unnamed protein product [Chondrus crispus]|uniref:Uncharacterized protein n=1 Tax=Chondrus crispus TaxID=2769 RepID=R7QKQ9_CHOCR|nr:unnamed protein product [Chondrus crispus]CDF38056.1 unnamed protein product [Chondrus crispus]|eukprot:XP_005717925.1 unnamed protein product [Chondrus crispus]